MKIFVSRDAVKYRFQTMGHSLSEGPGNLRELLAIALPMVVSQACETVMMFTDRLFLSRLGGVHMNAAMAGGLTCFLFMTFFIGTTGYTNALVAQYFGAGRREKCALVVTQGGIIALGAAVLLTLTLPLGHLYFAYSHIPPEQMPLQNAYFNIVMMGVGIALLRNVLSCFFSGIGKTAVVMQASLLSMLVNVGANYLLIFGKCGFPALGVRGAAYGTLIGGASGLVVIVVAYLGRENRRAYGVFEALRFDKTIMSLLLRLGYPAGLELFLNLLAFTSIVMAFHSYGLAAGAAATIAFNWDMVSFIPLVGMNIAVTSLVGRYMGAGEPPVAHRVTMTGLRLAFCYSGALLLVFACFPGDLVRMFRPQEASLAFESMLPTATFMVRLISFYVLADAVGCIFSRALRGAGDTFWAMCLSVGTHWALALSVLAMIRIFHASPEASWSVLVLMVFLIGGAFYLRYRGGAWRSLRIVSWEGE
ncbi:MAG TPA: MATE family efflux transporter [Synergistaceae bacterium]|nr:MATE family efflux transporter [Synergistaceae bacterium]